MDAEQNSLEFCSGICTTIACKDWRFFSGFEKKGKEKTRSNKKEIKIIEICHRTNVEATFADRCSDKFHHSGSKLKQFYLYHHIVMLIPRFLIFRTFEKGANPFASD